MSTLRLWAAALSASLAACSARGADGPPDSGSDAGVVEHLAIARFEASARRVAPGETVALQWEVEGASEIEVLADLTVLAGRAGSSGSVTSQPLYSSTTFVLRASAGAVETSSTVAVAVEYPMPSIESFESGSGSPVVGDPVRLTWVTHDATLVRAFREGVEVARFDAALVGEGAVEVIVDSELTLFALEASNRAHTARAELELAAVHPPVVDLFTASPRTFIGTSTTATITWSTRWAERVELLSPRQLVPGFPGTPSGTWALEVTGTTAFVLRTSWAHGYESIYLYVGRMAGEEEPNDTFGDPQDITRPGGALGAISPAGDVDWYVLYATNERQRPRVWITDRAGGCTFDAHLELYGEILLPKIAESSGPCARIDPEGIEQESQPYGYRLSVSGSTGSYAVYTEWVE